MGRMILNSDNPALFMAVSSLLSPKAPKVMIEESSMARGKAMGTMLKEA